MPYLGYDTLYSRLRCWRIEPPAFYLHSGGSTKPLGNHTVHEGSLLEVCEGLESTLIYILLFLLYSTTESPPDTGDRPTDCADILIKGQRASSGVYQIYPFSCECARPVSVFCDMETDGGGWTVFLKRENQSQLENFNQSLQERFNRSWTEYKDGFGSPSQEYWLGNEMLHKMTVSREYAVRLDLEYKNGAIHYYTRSSFKVNSEATSYTMTYSGTSAGSVSANCMTTYNSRPFTTYDRDNDAATGNCADSRGGGWWYYNCRYNNPTSVYKAGLNYTCYSNVVVEVVKLQMKIRPVLCDATTKKVFLNTPQCGSCGSSD